MFKRISNLWKKEEKEDTVTFKNWSNVFPTAAIYQIFETIMIKDNKSSSCYGLRVNLIFGDIDKDPDGLYIPFKVLFATPDLAYSFISRHLTPLFSGTSIIVMVLNKEDQLIGQFDLTKPLPEEKEEEDEKKKEYPLAVEGTTSVN